MQAGLTEETELAEQQKYYDDYWSSRATVLNAHELQRLAKILEAVARIAERPGGDWSVCDLGCGAGWLSNELCKFGTVTGVDLSVEGVQMASRRWPSITFVAHDILSWSAPAPFDLVVSSEVAEHIPDKGRFRDAILRATKPGGHIIVTTPNDKMRATWDASEMGAQLIEQWLSPAELRALFAADAEILWHQTFLFDFAYRRAARVFSAPKVLRLLKSVGLMPAYDAVREMAGVGLYQILLARKRGGNPHARAAG